jgi:hypothetical protein
MSSANMTWDELHPPGDKPSQRSGHSMVYDSGSGQVILLGGYDGSAYLNDTWAYRVES